MNYYDFENLKELACPQCKWKGSPKDTISEYFSDLKEVYCPKCNNKFFLVSYPTPDEVKKAVKLGNEGAKIDLLVVKIQEQRDEQFEATKLKIPEQLPDIKAKKIDFVWDKEGNDTLILYKGEIIWREIAYYEGWWRFNEVKEILKLKFGKLFHSLKPTTRSKMDLFGDDLSSPNKISYH